MNRITKDEYYLKIAETVSLRSTCLRAVCGAVLVKNDAIISTGYNGNPRGVENCCDSVEGCKRKTSSPNTDRHLCYAVHGEMNSIVNLARCGGTSSIGSILYVWFKRRKEDDSRNSYDKPCNECMKLIINAGISRIVNYTEDNYHTTLHETTIQKGLCTTKEI